MDILRVRPAAGDRKPLWLAYGLPVATSGAVLLALLGGGPDVPSSAPLIVFLLPIILSAYVGGLGPGLLATVLSTLASIYFILPPAHSIWVRNPLDNVKWIALAASGVLISVLMTERDRARARAASDDARTELFLTERKVRVAFAFMLTCLVVIAAVSYTTVARFREDTVSVDHSHQVIANLRLLLSTATDAETSARGYVITGREEYLEPYDSALQYMSRGLGELRRLTADNRVQQRRLDLLEPLLGERFGVLKEIIEKRQQGFEPAQAAVLNGWGKQLHDRVRAAVAEMEATERGLLRQREDRAQLASTITKVTIVAGSIMGLAIVAAALSLIGQGFTVSRRAQEALQRANAYNRSLIEASLDPLLTIAPDGKVRDVNSAVEKVTGRSRQDLLGTDFSDYFTDPAKAQAGYRRVFREGWVQDYELEFRHRDGHTTPVLYNASVYRNQKGEVDGVFAAARDITERKRAQEALEKERQRLFAVLETMPAMICLLTPDYHVAFANRAFRDRFGESHGRRCYEFCFGLPAPCDFCETYKVLETGRPHRWEVKCPDGSVIVAYDFPFTDSDGSPMILEMDIDVTEIKRAEAVRLLAAIVESSDDAIISKTLEGTVESWNRGAERLYGYSREEIVGRPVAVLLPPDHPDDLPGILERVGKGERVEHYETTRRRKDGRRVDVSLTVSPVRDAAGKLTGASTVARDITDRKRAEEQLRESEAQFRTLANAIPQLCWMANPDGWIFWYNERWYEYTGTTPEQMEGWGWQSVHDPETLPSVLERWKESLATGKTFDMVFPLRGADGAFRPFLTRVMPVRGQDAKVARWFGTNTDISERIRAEEALAQKALELARSNADLERFAYVASHDLQEPLRMVASFTQLLAKRYRGKLDGDADEFIGFAVDGARRMQILINDLLAYSRVGTRGKELAPTNCEAILEEALMNLKQAIEDTGAVVTHDALPTVPSDETQLSQVFQNLIANALKFHGAAPPRVHVSAQEVDGGWRFSVRDNGIGIDPQHAERIYCGLPTPAPPRRVSRHRHRSGHRQENRGAARRAHLGGIRARARRDISFHHFGEGRGWSWAPEGRQRVKARGS
jgi:PAS domain S-box-containing protein